MDEPDHVAVHELRRRQVDRNLERLRPGRRLAAGLAQDPLAHLDDQAAFLRDRDEFGRGDLAAHRMLPARQCLEADDLALGDAVARGSLRLEGERELAVLDRHREVLMQHAAIADLLVHLRLEKADRAARFLLGAEQRRAGVGEQRGAVGAVVREDRHAGGDTGADRAAVDLEFLGDGIADLLRQRETCLRLFAIDDQAELVAGQARHHAAARGVLEPLGHLDQKLVAVRVTEDVVDLLEAVEVDAQNRELLAGAFAGLDHLGQRLEESGTVRQVGEAVVIGHVRHARLGLPAVGDVLVGLDQILRLAGIAQHGGAAGEEQSQAVFGRDRMLLGDHPPLLDRGFVARDDQLGFLGIEDVGRGQARGFLAPAVEDRLRAAVGEQIAAVLDLLDDQGHRDVVDHELEEFLGALQLLRQRATVGDVLEYEHQEFGLVALVADHDPDRSNHAPLTGAVDLEFVAELAVRRIERRPVGRLDAGRRDRRKQLARVLADGMVARETPEPLIGAVGEDVAAILDVLRGHAGRHVVQHCFQELLGGGELPRQSALLADVQMRRHRAAVGQHEIFHQDGPPVRQFGDQTVGACRFLVELVVGDAAKHPALAPQFKDVVAVHVGPEIRSRQAVNLEIAVIAEDDAPLRIRHHHALVEIVHGGGDEGIAPQLQTPGPAQRGMDPQRDRGEERADDDARDQGFPDHVGIELAEIAWRGEAVREGKGARRRDHCGQAHDGLHRNRKRAAHVPVLLSHQPPAISTSDCLASRVWIG